MKVAAAAPDARLADGAGHLDRGMWVAESEASELERGQEGRLNGCPMMPAC